MTDPSKEMQQAMDQKFIVAVKKYFGPTTTITVDETAYTPAQITTMVQARVDRQADVVTARGNYSQAVAKARAEEVSSKPLYDGVKQVVLAMYGSNPAVLAEFGLSARKRGGPKDVAAKQAGIDKMLATRAARHTMGPRQKAKIKGVVAQPSPDGSATATSVPPAATTADGSAPTTVNVGASASPTVGSTPAAVNGAGPGLGGGVIPQGSTGR